MIRVLPQSLFGRMVLILMGGLILAQVLGAAISLYERRNLIARTGRTESAERIARVVDLLESANAPERGKLVEVLSTALLRVSLDLAPMNDAAGDREDNERSSAFADRVRNLLGKDRIVRVATASRVNVEGEHEVALSPRPAPDGLKPRVAGSIERGASTSLWFPAIVQVQLRDGTWVTFRHMLHEFRFFWSSRLLLNLLVLLAAVLLLLLIAVRWVTRPLHVLSLAAEALGRNIHSPPLAETGPLEVRRAAHAFNRMQGRLARYLEDRTRLLAAMSHDLKTPITRLRLRAELLDDAELKARFAKDLEDMESMVTETLDFIRGGDRRAAVQPVDVMALLESLQGDAEEIGREVTIKGAARSPYPGEPQALKRCIANLIDNAVKYGKRAAIHVDDSGKRLRITVRDDGPGIPEDKLDKVLEPFYRLDESRSRSTGGTGLGLTIARTIAEVHGGELKLSNAASGGLEAVLTLPRPQSV
jgi:signal transduction histidine kinase